MTAFTASPQQISRSAWIAAVKSLVLPGLGQWHNGQFNKAAWWLLGFTLLGVPGVAVIALWLPAAWMLPTLLIGLALTLSLWIGGAVDAFRVARSKELPELPGAPLPLWRQPGLTLLVLVICAGVALPMLTWTVRTHLVASFRIPSASMAPALWPGDIVFADRRYACMGCAQPVRRGDIAIFAYPNDRTQYYVKRVVGLPGDRIRIQGSEVSVNGQLLKPNTAAMPPDIALSSAYRQSVPNTPTADINVEVPPGQVFVLGDAYAASSDSRHFGGVPLADVLGRVRQIWWSHGPDGVRWGRLGRVVE